MPAPDGEAAVGTAQEEAFPLWVAARDDLQRGRVESENLRADLEDEAALVEV
jgi:hypothetical protein